MSGMDDQQIVKVAAATAKLFAAIALIPLSIAWSGYVFSILWAWFAVTTFSLSPLGTAQAIGVLLVFRFACPIRLPRDDEKKASVMWAAAALIPAYALLLGWIVKVYL